MKHVFRLEEFGYEVEIGEKAAQASGAVWFNNRGTILLSAATSAPMETEFPGFFPLTVDYKEPYSAAGKIPGGYFKREGKPSDREVLTGRFADRALRPLFPENFFDSVQIVSTVYSVNKEYMPNTMSLTASSLALVISDIPFLEPVGAVEVARLNGEWVYNPTYPQIVASDVRLIIAGTHEGICMVEGSAKEISESEFLDVLFHAHDKYIRKLVQWQREIQRSIGKQKKEIKDVFQWGEWSSLINKFLTTDRVAALYIGDKTVRAEQRSKMKTEFVTQQNERITELKTPENVIEYIFDMTLKKQITEMICKRGARVDGRAFDKVRPISVQVGLLPFTHGSGLFTRGNTQALATVTLGSGEDKQKLENIMKTEEESEPFMLHYNFLPFSSGEVRPMRGPGRREIGHGHLARSAFLYLLPDELSFPYTLRIVVDILESDGSTSMATVCSATMALMQAGVPLKKMAAGVAMGLLQSLQGRFITLTDISGFEDEFGLMDFKVVGTDDGITAIQMDVKYKGGLARSVFESALAQAKVARLHILAEMKKVMSSPNAELSELVPRVVTVKVPTDKIGAIIGSGGKTIREIIEATKTAIDIEEDGVVKIFGGPEADLARATRWVRVLGGEIASGEEFTGEIKRIAEFGLFVELVPGYDGLVHISNIPKDVQKGFAKRFVVGQKVHVQVLEHDPVAERTSLKLIMDKNSPDA
jgi:polyribonucleotide nucleotidyltransferase